MIRVTAVVVSFNTVEKLRRCLAALPDIAQIVVVDNASSDGSADMVASEFPHVELVRLEENIGFGPANNVGWIKATQPLVLFLNSDAYADPGAIATLADVFLDPEVVGAGGRLLNADRSLQESTANPLTLWAVFCEQSLLERVFRPGSVFSPYWTTSLFAHETTPVASEQVMGACLMVRRDSPERWDERFFLYCEDTDLCLRLRDHGRILYVPSATFVHDLGSSSADRRWLAVARYNKGKELYFQIHYGAWAMRMARGFNRGGALLRLILWSLVSIVKPKSWTQVNLFWKVLTAPYDLR